MKLANILFGITVFFILSCGSNDSKNNENSRVTDEITSQKDTNRYLTIEGKDIWIRNKPETGNVIMKLNTGDKCILLEKGKEQNIRGHIDFWYKIIYRDTEGWVFGSQTSLKSGKVVLEAEKRKKLEKTFNEISNIFQSGQLEELNSYFYEKNNIIIVNNQQGYIIGSFSNSLSGLKRYSDDFRTCKLKFEKLPVYEFSQNSEGWSKEGCFAHEIFEPDVFINTFKLTNEVLLIEFHESDYQKAQEFGKISTIKIIITQSFIRFYFTYKNEKWLLTALDIIHQPSDNLVN